MPPLRPEPPKPHPSVVERVATLRAEPTLADPVVNRWYQRFVAVADQKLRRTVLRECLLQADDGTLLGALARLDTRAEQGDAACRWMSTELALTPSILLELPYDRLADLYVAARATGLDRVVMRLYGDRPASGTESTENPHLDASAGERTARARSRDRQTLDRIAHDRDPRVIAALLDNPLVTERDVIRVAALRPTNPEVLRVVAAHPRWAGRYRVRKALAFNPATPTSLARQLIPTLLRQDLNEIAGSGVLAAELRETVREWLRERS